MKKWVWLTLLAIIFLAVLLRVLPLAKYAVWGSDTGEYYYLTNDLVGEGTMTTDYDGWGFGYPYFPGMFYLTGAVSMLAGTDLFLTLLVLTPVMSTLSVVFIFLMARRIGASDPAALIAAAFLTVSMPNVLTASHPMPGALADWMVIFCLFILLQSYNNKANLIILITASIALIITHHLSTYFLIISVLGIVLLREILKLPGSSIDRLRIDRAYIFFLVLMTLIFWRWYAGPFYEGVVEKGLGSTIGNFLIPLAVVGLCLFYFAVTAVRKYIHFRYRPEKYSDRRQAVLFSSFAVAGLITVILSTRFSLPPMESVPDPVLAVYLTPFLGLFIFGILGQNESEIREEGFFIMAWALAIVASMIVSMITGNQDIIVFRYFQYGMAPWAVLVGLGFVSAYTMVTKRRSRRNIVGITFTIVIVALVAAAGATAYPPRVAVAGFQEGIYDYEIDGVYWCRDNLEDGATVATDHRLSSMLFGLAGINGSWDSLYDTFHEERFEDIKDELANTTLPAGKKRVDYVVISNTFKEGVALVHYREAEGLTPEAEAKFLTAPFYKVYDSGKVQVYLIDWSYA